MKIPLRIIVVFCALLFGTQSVCRAQPAATNLWMLPLANYDTDSSPAIAPDGTIYQVTFDGRLVAVTPRGKIKWAFKTPLEIESSPAIADDGTIYFGSRDRIFYAVSPDGNLKWTFATGAWIDSSPAIAADGTVYFGSWDGNFYALNPGGSLKWKFPAGGIVDSSPAIGADGTIYFGSHDGNFYALTADGKLRWKFLTQGQIISSPAIAADGTVYFTSTDGNLYALKPDGTKLWRLHTGGCTKSSPVLDAHGEIYLAVNAAKIGVGTDGKQIWQAGSPMPIDASAAAAANGLVYFDSSWGDFTAFNAKGNLAWSVRMTTHGIVPKGSPAIGADGAVYLGDGKDLYSFATTNSAPLAKSSWPMWRANARHTGRVGMR
jgi:outer membrane protein assembly factor BamB